MVTHTQHYEKETFYFVTFACYNWLKLIEQTSLYDYLIKWVKELSNRDIKVCGYVFMPNHIHLVVYVEEGCSDFNKVIGEAKRFMAYEIVKRLKVHDEVEVLKVLSNAVSDQERKKGKKHQVFQLSFDANEITNEQELWRILDYIHHNPANKKWNLVESYLDYPYSSAAYYELERESAVKIFDYRVITSESPTG